MSVLKQRGLGDTPTQLIPSRASRKLGSVRVDDDSALRTSAVWASLRLRADLISTFPFNVYRPVGDLTVKVPTPPVLVAPGGEDMDIQTWLWATQFDLDRVGNCYGIISATDGFGLPARIDLVDHNTVTVIVNRTTGVVSYRISGKTYAKEEIWHERQFRIPGLIMGLSPVAYAAWDISQNQSATDFGLEWFANGAQIPTGHLKNTAKTVNPAEAQVTKDRYMASISARAPFVSGNDWEWTTENVEANASQFLETQKSTEAAIARFFGVPGDLIDIQSGTKSAVTYANVTQRNLQFLTMNLGPILKFREAALSKLVKDPRFVKADTAEILRLDPDTRNTMLLSQLGRSRVPSEIRAADDLPPFTEAQWAELQRFKEVGVAATAPTTAPSAPEEDAA